MQQENKEEKCDGECHFQEPYGYVPHAGCPLHDKMTEKERKSMSAPQTPAKPVPCVKKDVCIVCNNHVAEHQCPPYIPQTPDSWRKEWHKQLHTKESGYDEDHENFEKYLENLLTLAHSSGYEKGFRDGEGYANDMEISGESEIKRPHLTE